MPNKMIKKNYFLFSSRFTKQQKYLEILFSISLELYLLPNPSPSYQTSSKRCGTLQWKLAHKIEINEFDQIEPLHKMELHRRFKCHWWWNYSVRNNRLSFWIYKYDNSRKSKVRVFFFLFFIFWIKRLT